MANNSQHAQIETDIVIVGAGLVGMAAALAFASSGQQVVLLNPQPTPVVIDSTWDTRIYAITPSTQAWLGSLGVWDLVDQSRINHMHAMQLWRKDDEKPLMLKDSDANIASMGVIVENCQLIHALQQKLAKAAGAKVLSGACKHIKQIDGGTIVTLNDDTQVRAKLLVGADGAQSFVRQQVGITSKVKDYQQTAIVTNYKTEIPHGDVARQWFAPHETLAFLPLPNSHVSIVWAMSTEKAAELLSLTEDEFAHKVCARSKHALGTLQPVSAIQSFALKQITASQMVADGLMLVGDAAHQVHPMAGQGVNLGFRDVIAMQQLLTNMHPLQAIGDKAFLRQYERLRKVDVLRMNGLTSGLDALFALENVWLDKMVAKGFSVLNNQSKIKKQLIQQAVA